MNVLTDPRMAVEMAEQPGVVERLLARRVEVHDIVRRAMPEDLHGIALVGHGSSGHAALFTRYVVEPAARRPALVVPPMLANHHPGRLDYRGFLALGVSQSGRTPAVVRTLVLLRRAGAVTLAVTADPDSPLASVATATIDLATGAELAVPATKTFVASLVAGMFVAEALGAVPWADEDWTGVPDAIAATLADEAPSRAVARELAAAGRVLVLADGPMLAVARETALKLQEAAGILALAESSDAFRHGPIAIASRQTPAIVLAGDTGCDAESASLAALLSHLHVPVTMLSPEPGADLPLPPGMSDALGALAAAVRGQQLALFAAEVRGLDPDRPPYLTKTVS